MTMCLCGKEIEFFSSCCKADIEFQYFDQGECKPVCVKCGFACDLKKQN